MIPEIQSMIQAMRHIYGLLYVSTAPRCPELECQSWDVEKGQLLDTVIIAAEGAEPFSVRFFPYCIYEYRCRDCGRIFTHH